MAIFVLLFKNAIAKKPNSPVMDLKKLKIDELLVWIQSPEFEILANQPVSKHRAYSYASNPRIDKNDFILYMGFENNILVAYRTLLPDWAFKNEEKIKFAWLSGSWVHPDWRRKGLSSLLLKEIFKDWNSQLAYTNYTFSSHALFEKTKEFRCVTQFAGSRYYFRFSLAGLLYHKALFFKRCNFIFKFVDFIGNFLLEPWHAILQQRTKKMGDGLVVQLDCLSDEIKSFIESFWLNSLTQRGFPELDWMQNKPWIFEGDKKKQGSKYYFSDFEPNVHRVYLVFKGADGKINGFLYLNCFNNRMTVPYGVLMDSIDDWVVSVAISKLILRWKVAYLTVYNKDINKKMKHLKAVVYKKRICRKYFFTNKLVQLLEPAVWEFFDGDGDCVFT